MQVIEPNAVQALFFGDFLLSQQKKVTRPPGRIPGAAYQGQAALSASPAKEGRPT
ncbi:MAG TPA: hypothetical protein VLI72_16920 [Methylibium sp.]|nr:hypothetical protein [Methylibium sp.]